MRSVSALSPFFKYALKGSNYMQEGDLALRRGDLTFIPLPGFQRESLRLVLWPLPPARFLAEFVETIPFLRMARREFRRRQGRAGDLLGGGELGLDGWRGLDFGWHGESLPQSRKWILDGRILGLWLILRT